jgi:CRP/FNR family cyclic AMP-dependent transcriptional regulator
LVLPSARLWFEGKSKDLEEVLKEAEKFRLNGYARCVFPGGGLDFIILAGGIVREILEINVTNKPIAKSIRDLWGKSKIKEGMLQVFEIPPETGWYLDHLTGRRLVIPEGRALAELRTLLEDLRNREETSVVDVMTPTGKSLLIVDGKVITHSSFTGNEGLTLTGFEAFRRLVLAITKGGTFQAGVSRVDEDSTPGKTPWLPILLLGAGHSGPSTYLKTYLTETFGHYYGPGTVLFREGDAGKDLYLIVNGRVLIYKESTGTRKTLAELGPGDFFGEMAVFNDAPRTATAETIENCLLVRIGKEQLQMLLYNSFDYRIGMIKKLCRRLKDTDDETARLWEDPRALYLEKIIFQIIHADPKWQEEGIPPGILMQEISSSSGMRFSEIDTVFRKLLESSKIDFIRGKVIMKEPSNLP